MISGAQVSSISASPVGSPKTDELSLVVAPAIASVSVDPARAAASVHHPERPVHHSITAREGAASSDAGESSSHGVSARAVVGGVLLVGAVVLAVTGAGTPAALALGGVALLLLAGCEEVGLAPTVDAGVSDTGGTVDGDGGDSGGDLNGQKWNDRFALLTPCRRFLDMDYVASQGIRNLEILCEEQSGERHVWRCPAPTPETFMQQVTCENYPALPQTFESSPVRYKQLVDVGAGKMLITWETEAGRSGFSLIDRSTRRLIQETPLQEVFIPGTRITFPFRGISGAEVSHDRLILTFQNPDPRQEGGHALGDGVVFQFNADHKVRLDDVRAFRTTSKRPVAIGANGPDSIAILNTDAVNPSVDVVKTTTIPDDLSRRRNTPLMPMSYQAFPELATMQNFAYVANAENPAALIRIFTSTTATATPQRIDLPSAVSGTITDTSMLGNVVLAVESGGNLVFSNPQNNGMSFKHCITPAGHDPQTVVGLPGGLVATTISGVSSQQPGESPRIAIWFGDPADCH